MSTHVLSIGYGRQLFLKDNGERQRLLLCSEKTGAFHMIVFSLKSHNLISEHISDTFFLYPTHSRSRLLMMYDALRIGFRILKEQKKETWCITSQDPLASGLVAFILSRISRIPLVIQEHGDIFSGFYWRRESWGNRLWYPIAVFLIRRAERVRAVSKRVAAHLVEVGVKGTRIVTLPVFTDISSLEEKEITQSARDFFPPDSLVVLSAARFVLQKNLLLLIHAFAEVVKKVPQAHLLLVGAGPLLNTLRAEVSKIDIETSVHFIEWVPDISSLMKTSDVYALSSNYEGWGRVLIEAMACGVPVVTTDVGCAAEVCLSDVHGKVVPVKNQGAFADALSTLLVDRERRASLGMRAKVDAQKLLHDPSLYASKWARVYEGL